ncbi:TIGR02391 family protein [Litorimonas sp. RW-G-Af-16]|uniref:TIGR02391 family protein n=1 Tax=Litorimonas sp. RW-G-Af-16 TaxID=3241168 RepID=UPI00390CC241
MTDKLKFLKSRLPKFESNPYVNIEDEEYESLHPFDERNIHPEIRKHSLALFDDGHYSQATFEAFKYIDNRVKKICNVSATGEKLMMTAFNEGSPLVRLNNLSNDSEKDEQRGYRFIFAGSVAAIRNPRGHEVNLPETTDTCLDHLSFASLLLRRIDNAVGPIV